MFALCPHGVELIDGKEEMIEKASGTHISILLKVTVGRLL